MVRISCVTTRGGDKGLTSLGDGTRVSKSDLRIAAIGEVDELNSTLGLAICHIQDTKIVAFLRHIQNDLFDMGADLCSPSSTDGLKMTVTHVETLDEKITYFNANLAPLTSFILPGGSLSAAHLHMVRTVARRAERACVTLQQSTEINHQILRYLNRLSDLAFVLARFVHTLEDKCDILWVPGENR